MSFVSPYQFLTVSDFENFVEDLELCVDKQVGKKTEANKQYVQRVDDNLNSVKNTFKAIKTQMQTFDGDLIEVLNKHEQDFMHAYQLHMKKIETELLQLKNKSKD
jgi:archaellum component FlaC